MGALPLRALVPTLLAALALVACKGEGGGPAAGPVATPEESVCGANPSPVNPDDPSIIVEVPQRGDVVSSPLRAVGRARVFEATVSLRLLGADGEVLVDAFTTADAGAPEFGAFAAEIPYSVAEDQPGCLWVFESSAKDGSPVNVVQVPVFLTAAAVSTP